MCASYLLHIPWNPSFSSGVGIWDNEDIEDEDGEDENAVFEKKEKEEVLVVVSFSCNTIEVTLLQ